MRRAKEAVLCASRTVISISTWRTNYSKWMTKMCVTTLQASCYTHV